MFLFVNLRCHEYNNVRARDDQFPDWGVCFLKEIQGSGPTRCRHILTNTFSALSVSSRLLIVDDDAGTILLLRKILRDIGEIFFSKNGTEALCMIEDKKPDIVLLDVQMPGMDGFDVCAAIKMNKANQDLPIIFVTSDTGTKSEIRGLALGAVDFITKPLNPSVIRSRVKTHLALKKRNDELYSIIIERQKMEEELQRNHDRLASLASQIPGIVYQLRLYSDGRVACPFISDIISDICGLDPEQLQEDATPWLNLFHPDDKDWAIKTILDSVRTLQPWKQEYRVIFPKTGIRWMQGEAMLEKMEDGSVLWHGYSRDITETKKFEELIWKQANFDSLTGLPNRRMLLERLEKEIMKAQRTSMPLALMFLDLDYFKDVNDTLGHGKGDLLLEETARRLIGCVRKTDVVARLGGDEFTIILPCLTDLNSVERIAKEILDKLSEPFKLEDEVAYVTASIGMTLYPNDAADSESLLKNADQAMYAAKELGRNRFSYYDVTMQAAALNRRQLISNLHGALKNEQFRVVYQPIVELATGVIQKAEALVRWHHPERGLVSPIEFIPIAEEIGMIHDIGNWMFREAAELAGKMREVHHPGFQVSVNISPMQFKFDGIRMAPWFTRLKQMHLPKQGIVVEITEGLLLDAGKQVKDQLLGLRDAGIEVALDDFGTGYSSLSYLKKFDIDYIKIDQSFVSNLTAESDDLALCEAMIVMAHRLGIKVIAEGVETPMQRDLLLAAGCDYAQGFLFSRPISDIELSDLVTVRSKRPLLTSFPGKEKH